MGASSSQALTVHAAGREICLAADCREVLARVSGWLGPWAEAAGPARDRASLRIDMCESPETARRRYGGEVVCVLRSDEFDLTFLRREDRDGIVVRYARGFELAAARAAIRVLLSHRVTADGGVALHASSVGTPTGVLVFAGPSGRGKTSAAGTFAPHDRLDSDLVLLEERGGAWRRLDLFDEYGPARFAPGPGAGLPVRAILFPRPGAAFRLRLLSGAEAAAACLHLPPPVDARLVEGAVADAATCLARAERLVASVRVAEFTWRLEDDLSGLLDASL